MKEIYQQTVEEVLDYVESIESGLTSEQVKRSRENCGWNELAEGKKKSILQIFFEQYKDFLVLILIASAVISGMLGDVESAAVIVIVITINAAFVKAKAFYADQTCTGCGKCVKVCPLNNVTMKNKKPVWEKHCTHCMACICYCPAEAIEYGRKSVGKPRYCFENLGLEKYDYSNPLK